MRCQARSLAQPTLSFPQRHTQVFGGGGRGPAHLGHVGSWTHVHLSRQHLRGRDTNVLLGMYSAIKGAFTSSLCVCLVGRDFAQWGWYSRCLAGY